MEIQTRLCIPRKGITIEIVRWHAPRWHVRISENGKYLISWKSHKRYDLALKQAKCAAKFWDINWV